MLGVPFSDPVRSNPHELYGAYDGGEESGYVSILIPYDFSGLSLWTL